MSGNNTNDMLAEVNRIKDLYPDSTLYEVDVREALVWALDFAHSDMLGNCNSVIITLKFIVAAGDQNTIKTYFRGYLVEFQDFSNSIYRK